MTKAKVQICCFARVARDFSLKKVPCGLILADVVQKPCWLPNSYIGFYFKCKNQSN